MKKSAIFFIVAVCSSVNLYAQIFDLKGLEVYNPVYSNPAFISIDKFVQTDIVAYDFGINNGFWLNAVSHLPGSNSSVGLSLSGGKYFKSYSSLHRDRSDENVSSRNKSPGISYAYSYSITDQMKLAGGVRFIHSMVNFSDTTTNLLSINSGFLNFGLKFSFRELYVGLSAGTGLYRRDERSIETDDNQVTWERLNTFSSSFIAGYSLGAERRVNLDPVIGYNFNKDLESGYSNFGFYVGGKISFWNIIGLGFTVGNQFSISTSVSVPDRASLIIGLYQVEKSQILVSRDYSLGFDPLRFIVQARITL